LRDLKMESWFQSQLKVAENLLDAVDKTVTKTIVRKEDGLESNLDGASASCAEAVLAPPSPADPLIAGGDVDAEVQRRPGSDNAAVRTSVAT
jgi:hypothetical protein